MKINLIFQPLKQNPKNDNKNSTANKMRFVQTQCFAQFQNYQALLNKSLINFNGNEDNFSQELSELLKKGENNELFLFLDKKLREKAKKKGISYKILDDVVQSAMVKILEAFQDFKNGKINDEELLESIKNTYTKLKPQKDYYINNTKSISINTPILKGDTTLEDTISDDEKYKIKYLKEADEQEKQEGMQKLKEALKGVELSKKEQDLLELKYKKQLSYRKIAKGQGNSATTIRGNIRKALKRIQLAKEVLPEKELENAKKLVEKFEKDGLTLEKYLRACLRQPQLFYKPHKITESKVVELVEKFKKEGLTIKKYLPACIDQPSLFCLTPDKVETNVRDLVKKFENEGLTVEKYLTACLNKPQLFTQSPDTIEANVRDLVKKFENEGLTVEKYLTACLNKPQLFYQSPDTIERNVRDLVKKFENEGLTVERYLLACLNMVPLFTLSADTVGEHMKALIFVKKNMKKDSNQFEIIESILKKPILLTSKNQRNYSLLLRKKMFPIKAPKGLGGTSKVNEKISNYLKENKGVTFKFSITQDEMSKEFIEYAKKLALEATGKEDIFDIEIENKNGG